MLLALEPNHESGGNAEVVLVPRAQRAFPESRQQVLCLKRTDRKVIEDLVIHSASRGHGKRILRAGGAEGCSVGVCRTEKHLSEWRDPAVVTVGNTRPEKVRRERAVVTSAKNVSLGIAAEIGNATEPVRDVVGHVSVST